MVLFRTLTLTKILLCTFIINYATAQRITTDPASSLQSSSTGSQSSDIEEIPPPDQIFHSNQDELWSNANTFTDNKKQSPTLDIENHEELVEILDTPIHTHDNIYCNEKDDTKEQEVSNIDTKLSNVEEIPNYDVLGEEPQIVDLEASSTICIAGYDNEIYKLMYDIQTDQGTEVLIVFYVYKDSKYNYLGCSMIDLEILKQKLMKYSHYYLLCTNYLEKYSKETNTWYIDDFMIEPNTKDGTYDLRNDQFGTVFNRFSPNIDGTDINFNNFDNSVPTFSKNEEVKSNEGYIVLENTINNQDTDKYIELESRYDKENNRFEVHLPNESDIIFNPISFHLYLNHSCNNETTNINADDEVEFNDDMNKNRVEVLNLRDKECMEDVYVTSETEKNCVEENNDSFSVINNYDRKPHEIEAKDNDIGNLNDCKSSNKFIFDENVVRNDDKLVTINNVLSLDVSEPPGLTVKSNYLDNINDNLLENDLSNTQNLKEKHPFNNIKYSDPQIICTDLQLNKLKTASNMNSANVNPYNNNIIFNTPKYGTLSPNINSKPQINDIANTNEFLLKKNNDISNVNLNYKPKSPVNSKFNLGGSQYDNYNTIWSNNMENLKNPFLYDSTVSSINSDNQLNIPYSYKVNSNNYIPNINLLPLDDAMVINNLNTKNMNYIPNDSENAVKQCTNNMKPLHISVNNDYNSKPKDIIFCNLVNGKSEISSNVLLSNKARINYNSQAIIPNAKPYIDCNKNKRTYLQMHPHKIAESTQVKPLYDQTYDISNVINERFPIVQDTRETQKNYKSLPPTKEYNTNQFRPILDNSLLSTTDSNKYIDNGLNKLQSSIDYISRDEFNKIVRRPNLNYIFNKPAVTYEVTDEKFQTKPLEGIVNTNNLEPSIETPYWIPVANPSIHLKAGLNKITNKPVNKLNNDVNSQIVPFILTPEILSNNHVTSKSPSLLKNLNIDEGVSQININNDFPTNMIQYFPETYSMPINIGSNNKNIKTFYTNIKTGKQHTKNTEDVYQDKDNLLCTLPTLAKSNKVLQSTAVDASTLYPIFNPDVSTSNIKEAIPQTVKWQKLQGNLNNVNEIYHSADEICAQNNQRDFTVNYFANGKANTPYAKPILQIVDNQTILLKSNESVDNNNLKQAFGQTLPIENFANIFPSSYPSFEAKGLVDSKILIPNIQKTTSNYFPKLNTKLLKSVPLQNIFIDTQKLSKTAPAKINKLNNNQNIISNPNIETVLEKPYLANELTYLSNIDANQIRPDFKCTARKQRFNNVLSNAVPFMPFREGTNKYMKSAINNNLPNYLTTDFDTNINVIKQNDEPFKRNFNMVNNIESAKLNIINDQYDPNVQEFNLENNIKPCHVTQIPASLIESNKNKYNPYFPMSSSLPFPKTGESKFDTFYVPNKSSSTLLPMHSFYAPNDEPKKWPLPTQQHNDAVLYPKYYESKSTLAFPMDFKPIINNFLKIQNNGLKIGHVAQYPHNNLPLNTIKELPLYKIDNSKIPIIKSINNVLVPKTDYMQPVYQNNPQVNVSDITQLNQNGINSYFSENEGSSNGIDYNPNINHDHAKQAGVEDNLVTNVANNLNNVKLVNHKYIERFNTPIPAYSLSPIGSYSNCYSNIRLPNLPKVEPNNEFIKFNNLPTNASLQGLIPRSPLIMHLSYSSSYPLLPSPTNLYEHSSETPSLGTFQTFLSNLPKPVIANPVTSEPLFEKLPNTPSKSLTNYVPVTSSLSYDLPSPNSFYKQSLKSPSLETLQSSLSNLPKSLSLKELIESNTPKTSTSLPEIFPSIPSQMMANPVPVSILSDTVPVSPTSFNEKSMITPIESLQNSLQYLPKPVITSSPINILCSNRPLESMAITNSVPLSKSSYALSPINSYQQPIKTPATSKLQNFLENLPKPMPSYKSFKSYNPTRKPLLEIYPNVSPNTISNPISLSTSYVPPPSPTNLYEQSLKTPSLGTLQNMSNLPKPVIPYKSVLYDTPKTASSINIPLLNSPSKSISTSNIVPLDAALPYYLPLSSTNNYEKAIKKSLSGALQHILPKPPNESVKLNAVPTETPLLETFSNILSESLVIPKTLSATSYYSPLLPINSYELPMKTPTIGTLQNFLSNLPESVTTESISLYPQSELSSSNKPVYLTSAGIAPKSSITSADVDSPNYFTSFLPKDPLKNSFADFNKSVTAKSTQISQLSSHNLKNPHVLPLIPSNFYEQPTEVSYLSVTHDLLPRLPQPGTANSAYYPQSDKTLSYIENSLLPNNYSQFSKPCNLQTPDTSRLSLSNIQLPVLESLNTPISRLTKSVYPNFAELFPQTNKAISFYDLKNIYTVQPSTSSHLYEQSIKPINIPQYPSTTAKSITGYPQLNTATIYSNIQHPYLTLSSNNDQPSIESANMPLAFPTKSVSTKSMNIYPQSSLTSSSNIVNTPLSVPLIPISPEISENFISNLSPRPLNMKSNKESPLELEMTSKSSFYPQVMTTSYTDLAKSYGLPLSLNVDQSSVESRYTPFSNPTDFPLKSGNIYSQSNFLSSNNILENLYDRPPSLSHTSSSAVTLKNLLPTLKSNQKLSTDLPVIAKSVGPQFNLASFYSNLKKPKPNIIVPSTNNYPVTPLDCAASKSYIQTYFPDSNIKTANNPESENIFPILNSKLNLTPNSAIPYTTAPDYFNQIISNPTFIEESRNPFSISPSMSPPSFQTLSSNPIQKVPILNNPISYTTTPSYYTVSPNLISSATPSLYLAQPLAEANLKPIAVPDIPIFNNAANDNQFTKKIFKTSFTSSLKSPSGFSVGIPSLITQPTSAQSNLNLIPTSEIIIPINPTGSGTTTGGNLLSNEDFQNPFVPSFVTLNIIPSSSPSVFQPAKTQSSLIPIPIPERPIANNINTVQISSPYNKPFEKDSQTYISPYSFEAQNSILNAPTLLFQSPIETKPILCFPTISSKLNDMIYQGDINSNRWQQSSVLNLKTKPQAHMLYPPNNYQMVDNEKQNSPLSYNIDNLSNNIESDLIKNLKSSETLKNNLFNNVNANVSIPLGNIGISKYINDKENTFVMKTDDPNINLKGWYSKLKVLKAKLIIEATDTEVANFMPIVYDRFKYNLDKVQEVAKNAVSKTYGEPLVIKGVYCKDKPYAVVNNVENALLNDKLNILWPTYCSCGCEKSGCDCFFKNCF